MSMLECFVAWVFLIVGVLSANELLLIASGLFAVATNLNLMRKDKGE